MGKILLLTTLCLLTIAVLPGVQAEPGPGPQCMPVYQEYEVGPVKVVRPNSCSAEVYVFGEPLLR